MTDIQGVCIAGAMAAWWTFASPARACEPSPCGPPNGLPQGGTVPSNLAGLPLRAEGLVRADMQEVAAGVIMVPFEVRGVEGGLSFVNELRVGAEYRLRVRDQCEAGEWHSTFRAAPAASLPKVLGKVVALPPQPGALTLAHRGGACSEAVRANYVDVAVELSKEAEPWAEVLAFETLVDGKPWAPQTSLPESSTPFGSWRGRGRDRVYATCSRDALLVEGGLSEGRHEVRFRATLFGEEAALETPAIRFSLRCPKQGDVYTGELDVHWLEWLLVACGAVAVALALRMGRKRGG